MLFLNECYRYLYYLFMESSSVARVVMAGNTRLSLVAF